MLQVFWSAGALVSTHTGFPAHVRRETWARSTSVDDVVSPPTVNPTAEAVSAYSRHWSELLSLELAKASEDVQLQFKTWSRRRLGEEGYSVFGLLCTPAGEVRGGRLCVPRCLGISAPNIP